MKRHNVARLKAIGNIISFSHLQATIPSHMPSQTIGSSAASAVPCININSSFSLYNRKSDSELEELAYRKVLLVAGHCFGQDQSELRKEERS